MKCENCGAEFDAKESKCPYCGALNLSGAEEQYMNHLEEMNRSFAEMADDSQEEYRYTFLSQGKKIGKILAMIGTFQDGGQPPPAVSCKNCRE